MSAREWVRSYVDEKKAQIEIWELRHEALFVGRKIAVRVAAQKGKTQQEIQKIWDRFRRKMEAVSAKLQAIRDEVRALQAFECPDYAYHIRRPGDAERCSSCDAYLHEVRPE